MNKNTKASKAKPNKPKIAAKPTVAVKAKPKPMAKSVGTVKAKVKSKSNTFHKYRVAKNKTEKQINNGLTSVNIKNHKDKKGGHPHIIVDNIDDKHVSVGLSTKPTKGKGSTNYTLEISPLNDGRQSYMRRQGIVAPQKEYEKPRQGKMTSKDYKRAKEYGDKAKRKYIEKNDKKK